MSSGYRALLQSLDETESDVTRGLGRSIKIKNRRPRCCPCCCRGCCMWTSFAIVILLGLVLSIGVPILITVPAESAWYWKNWLPKSWTGWNANNTLLDDDDKGFNADAGSYQVDGSEQQMNGTSGNWTMPVLGGHHGNHHHHAAGNGSTQAEVSGNDTTTVLQEAVNQLHKMTEWMKDQYDKTPKVPLIVALCVFLLAILSVVWFIVYRKIKRRQRRRTLGKMVTDLQSGKTLLNSDDSEDD